MHGHLCPLSAAPPRATGKGFAHTRANVAVSVSLPGGAPQVALQPPAQMGLYGQQPPSGQPRQCVQQPPQPVYGQPATPSTYSAPVAHAPGGK